MALSQPRMSRLLHRRLASLYSIVEERNLALLRTRAGSKSHGWEGGSSGLSWSLAAAAAGQ